MADEELRVGLIGAGGNVRNRHIPGFQKVPCLEILGVANRSLASSRSVADQFNIPRVYNGWQELLEDDDINAVCIGTWPYMHRTLTLAALEKGKHVLTEARMASTAQEAQPTSPRCGGWAGATGSWPWPRSRFPIAATTGWMSRQSKPPDVRDHRVRRRDPGHPPC